jgi:hypothetical protein
MPNIIEGSWTDRSLAWVVHMRAQHKDLSPKEQERICRKQYPFNQRKGWAYKAWLKAMRISFKEQGGEVKKIPTRCPKTQDLFEHHEP